MTRSSSISSSSSLTYLFALPHCVLHCNSVTTRSNIPYYPQKATHHLHGRIRKMFVFRALGGNTTVPSFSRIWSSAQHSRRCSISWEGTFFLREKWEQLVMCFVWVEVEEMNDETRKITWWDWRRLQGFSLFKDLFQALSSTFFIPPGYHWISPPLFARNFSPLLINSSTTILSR